LPTLWHRKVCLDACSPLETDAASTRLRNCRLEKEELYIEFIHWQNTWELSKIQ
jgi:hypothetical protein